MVTVCLITARLVVWEFSVFLSLWNVPVYFVRVISNIYMYTAAYFLFSIFIVVFTVTMFILGGGVNGVIFKTEETTCQAIK